ncbi:MAG TPA: carboxymuconolactone decarboxylase family protein [Bryobacteraceae bacterium]|jgi:4-carboxymuconolactone decarboxylase|nr:carboxymuconolactone decarboxylase family protein [Bryobacteraceae bacterium]
MNIHFVSTAAVGFGVVAALALAGPSIHLRGDRFKPLTYEQLTPQQKTMMDHLLAGERGGSTEGPFNVFLRSPEMGDAAQQLGAQVRFHSSLPRKLSEIAILVTARYWGAQFEWTAHRKNAAQAGVSNAIIDAVANGKRPTGMQADEEAVYNFCHELLTNKQVSDATFKATVGVVGERGVVDLIGVIGYYSLVAMALNVDRYPVGEGGKPELKPLP